jgi:hypothetical protein
MALELAMAVFIYLVYGLCARPGEGLKTSRWGTDSKELQGFYQKFAKKIRGSA